MPELMVSYLGGARVHLDLVARNGLPRSECLISPSLVTSRYREASQRVSELRDFSHKGVLDAPR